jgi:hypothetical protein
MVISRGLKSVPQIIESLGHRFIGRSIRQEHLITQCLRGKVRGNLVTIGRFLWPPKLY